HCRQSTNTSGRRQRRTTHLSARLPISESRRHAARPDCCPTAAAFAARYTTERAGTTAQPAIDGDHRCTEPAYGAWYHQARCSQPRCHLAITLRQTNPALHYPLG